MKKMTKKNKDSELSTPTVLRLSEYLLILEQLMADDVEVVSSRELADLFGNTPSQVRQDIFRLNSSGRVGQGYSIKGLTTEIRKTLGLSNIKNVCIIGVGNLGRALGTHVPFKNYGMNLVAAFDILDDVVGSKLNSVTIEDLANIEASVVKKNVHIAAICVPASKAQKVCDQLVKCGVNGILNYSRVRLKVPKHVTVKYQQVICSFMQLSYTVNGA
jgi:redox-sensing transcriptional repressor